MSDWRHYTHEAFIWLVVMVVLFLAIPALPLVLFILLASKADERLTEWEER